MKCNFCEKKLKEELGFKNIFSKKEKFILCEKCIAHFNIYEEKIDDYTLYYFSDYDFIKESIYKIKYFGDIKEAKKYKMLFERFFSIYNFDLVTIVPVNTIREYIRGFDHIEQLCLQCNVKFEKILSADYRPKQAKLHKKRALHKIEFFREENIKKDIKTILIIDDVVTSGKTLISCANVFENIMPNVDISFLTLAKSNVLLKL